MSLKDQYQYRKFSAKAEGEKGKNCGHCKHFKLMYCKVIKDNVKAGFLCDRFGRGK